MPRLRCATKGRILKNVVSGFPLYVEKQLPRVITADIWAFFKHAISTSLVGHERNKALAFLEQSFEFYEAAKNPRLSTRPVLYYYASLNLVKVYLILREIELPAETHHGIFDPKVNIKHRLDIRTQAVKFPKRLKNHSAIFPELITELGGTIKQDTSIKLIKLLCQIPGIHRTFCKITNKSPGFLPVKRFDIIRTSRGEICIRLVLDKETWDVPIVLKSMRPQRSFKALFSQVAVPDGIGEIWFETRFYKGFRRKRYTAIKQHAQDLQRIGAWAILTNGGWRYYLSSTKASDRIPPLVAIYAVMFYLGSITRYKPYDFEKIFEGKYCWLISEFLRTQPIQFLYGIAGHVAGTAVVRPFAVLGE